MGSWQKVLADMVADPNPRSYSYDEAARILMHLGFSAPRKATGSHRKFRIEIDDGKTKNGKRGVVIGLVDRGRGNLKPKYISQMIATLRENKLLPTQVENS